MLLALLGVTMVSMSDEIKEDLVEGYRVAEVEFDRFRAWLSKIVHDELLPAARTLKYPIIGFGVVLSFCAALAYWVGESDKGYGYFLFALLVYTAAVIVGLIWACWSLDKQPKELLDPATGAAPAISGSSLKVDVPYGFAVSTPPHIRITPFNKRELDAEGITWVVQRVGRTDFQIVFSRPEPEEVGTAYKIDCDWSVEPRDADKTVLRIVRSTVWALTGYLSICTLAVLLLDSWFYVGMGIAALTLLALELGLIRAVATWLAVEVASVAEVPPNLLPIVAASVMAGSPDKLIQYFTKKTTSADQAHSIFNQETWSDRSLTWVMAALMPFAYILTWKLIQLPTMLIVGILVAQAAVYGAVWLLTFAIVKFRASSERPGDKWAIKAEKLEARQARYLANVSVLQFAVLVTAAPISLFWNWINPALEQPDTKFGHSVVGHRYVHTVNAVESVVDPDKFTWMNFSSAMVWLVCCIGLAIIAVKFFGKMGKRAAMLIAVVAAYFFVQSCGGVNNAINSPDKTAVSHGAEDSFATRGYAELQTPRSEPTASPTSKPTADVPSQGGRSPKDPAPATGDCCGGTPYIPLGALRARGTSH